MKVIEGFEPARSALSRRSPATGYPVSARLKESLKKLFGTEDPEQAVGQIIRQVRESGDAALSDLSFRIDGIKLNSFEVSKEEIKEAYRSVEPRLVSAIRFAAARVRAFHDAQKTAVLHEVRTENLRQLIRPLERVGVYAPGGTATYPSTVLMTAIPARAAGVAEIVLCTPPHPDGRVAPAVLAAADVAGVDRVFSIGGAQAVAALAYGTVSVPKVDKICGPGNIFVMLAKKLVYGSVDIDGLQGPSEVLVIADDTTDPVLCAAELLAQAEHDALAGVVLVTTSRALADNVQRELVRQLTDLPRREIVARPLDAGTIALVDTLGQACDLANDYAPEHLCIMIRNAEAYIDQVRNAGCVVAGEKATVVLGDYNAGPSHALPTGGTARFGSPLNVVDFIKFINVIKVDDAILTSLGPSASVMAKAEGLDAHARALKLRLNPETDTKR